MDIRVAALLALNNERILDPKAPKLIIRQRAVQHAKTYAEDLDVDDQKLIGAIYRVSDGR